MIQPSSQRLDDDGCPRRETEAKAEVNRPTANISGSLLQSTKAHPRLAKSQHVRKSVGTFNPRDRRSLLLPPQQDESDTGIQIESRR